MPRREDCEALDAADPVAALRGDFVLSDPSLLYLDGNSLGRLPNSTRARLARVVEEEWGTGLVRSWDHWIDQPVAVGDRLGAALLGAAAGQVVVADNTTVNLYKLLSAAVASRPGAIVVDRHEFPTDRYVAEGVAAAHGRELRWIESDPVEGPQAAEIAIAAAGAAVVLLSLVGYRSGALADAAAITEAVHTAGGLVLWDLSHAAGAVPIELDAVGVDLAVGCTYKYLNAGPGAPAFLYVRADLQDELVQPIWGWFGRRAQFAMEAGYEPAEGVLRTLTGTPPILGLAAVDEGVAVLERVGIGALRARSVALTSLLIDLHDAWLAPLGFDLGTPRDPLRRGGHVSLRHPEAWRLCQALRAEGVVPDFRGPDSVRLGPVAAYTRFVDVFDALERLRDLTTAGRHLAFGTDRARVT